MKTAALQLFLTALGAIHCLDQAMADNHATDTKRDPTLISQATPGAVIFDTSEPVVAGAEEMTTDTPNVFTWSRYQIGRIDGWSYRLYPDGSATVLSDADRSADNFAVNCSSANVCTVVGSDGISTVVKAGGTRRPNLPAEIDGQTLSRYLADWILAGPDAAPPLKQVAKADPSSDLLMSGEISPAPSSPAPDELSENRSDGIAGRQLPASPRLAPAVEQSREAPDAKTQPESDQVAATPDEFKVTAPEPAKTKDEKVTDAKLRPEKTGTPVVADAPEAQDSEPKAAEVKKPKDADPQPQPEKLEVAALPEGQKPSLPKAAENKNDKAAGPTLLSKDIERAAVPDAPEVKTPQPSDENENSAEDANSAVDKVKVAAIAKAPDAEVSRSSAMVSEKTQLPASAPKANSVEMAPASDVSRVTEPAPEPGADPEATTTAVDVAVASAMSEDCSAPDPLFPDMCAVPTTNPSPPKRKSTAPSPEANKSKAQAKPDFAPKKPAEPKPTRKKDPSLAERLRLSCSLNYGLALRHTPAGSKKERIGKSSTSLGCGIRFTDRLTMRVSLIGYPFSGQRQDSDPDFAYSLNFKATEWLAFSYSNYSGRFKAPGNGFVDSLKDGSFRASLKLPHLALPFDKTAACSIGIGLPNPIDTSTTLSCGLSITERLRLSGTAHFYAPGKQISTSPDFSYTASYRFTDRVTLTYSNYANNRWPWNRSEGRDGDFLDGSFSLSYKLKF